VLSVPDGTIDEYLQSLSRVRDQKPNVSIVPLRDGHLFCFIPSTSYWATFTVSLRDKSPYRAILGFMLTRMGNRRLHFNATLQVAVSWLFFGVARSLRINLDMLDGRALKNSQLIRRLPDGVIISHPPARCSVASA
jgi:hypothetical protein